MVEYLHNAGAAMTSLMPEARRAMEAMQQELLTAPAVYHSSEFWQSIAEIHGRILSWSGEENFKRTINQNYFNFIPVNSGGNRMARARRLMPNLSQDTLDRYVLTDPDRDPSSWMSCYPGYYIFKEPDRTLNRELYREYLARIFEYAASRDRTGLLLKIEEPTLGNPISVRRSGRLISQDIINSVRERNAILAAAAMQSATRFFLAELGAGYGRLGYLICGPPAVVTPYSTSPPRSIFRSGI